MKRVITAALAMTSVALVAACGGSMNLTSDASGDTSPDGSDVSDSASDTLDALPDDSGDGIPDPTPDTTIDIGPDPTDTPPDPIDVWIDPDDVPTEPDLPPDTAVDVPPDGPLPAIVCTAAATIGCGETVSSSNDATGSTTVIEDNGCGTWEETGPEIAYAFTFTSGQRATFDLEGLSEDLDMFLFPQTSGVCDATACLENSGAGDANPERITYTGSAGETVYLMIDGWRTAVSDFDLTVSCVTPEDCDDGVDNDLDGDTDCDDGECRWILPCFEDVCNDGIDNDIDGSTDCVDFDCQSMPGCSEACTAVVDVDCGANLTGDTRTPGTPDEIDRWSCSTWNESGPEVVYAFTASTSTGVTARISGLGVDLDIFIVEGGSTGCSNSACISFDNNTAVFDASAGTSYFVIIDGYNGVSGSYDLSITCG